MKQSTVINLALAFDQVFLTPFYVLLASVFDSNRSNKFHFHLIATGIADRDKEAITGYIQEHNSSVDFYELDQSLLNGVVMPHTEQRYTIANLYRLYFPMLIDPAIKKLLYIDTDIVVVGDLLSLYSMDISNVAFGAVVDPVSEIRMDLGITRAGEYFNSGVLLINMDRWKEYKISEQALQFINTYPEKCRYVDQCALNAVAIGKWQKLDSRFNLMGQLVPDLVKRKYAIYLADKVIIHFNIRKPWDPFCQMRLKYLYNHYFKLSPQKDKRLVAKFDTSIVNIGRLARNKAIDVYKDYFAGT
jgi:lipopolysaccharide biosynthesis glycosyltransferase